MTWRVLGLLCLVACEGTGLEVTKPIPGGSKGTPVDTAASPPDSGQHVGHDSGTPLACLPEELACVDGCIDPETDPRNCGDCGVVCVVPHASAVCEDTRCGIGICDDGWGDCDGLEDNGCETEAGSASADPTCTTTCNSVGTLDHTDVCNPTCTAPEETCDHTDEDCDGVCDNGALAGCRQGIYRTNGSLGHMYGTDLATLEERGQTVEFENYFYLYADELPGTRALYRCDKGSGRTFLTSSSNCEIDVSPEATIGYISTDATCGGMPLFRLYSSAEGDHFYTISESERDTAVNEGGYRLEATIGYVYAGP